MALLLLLLLINIGVFFGILWFGLQFERIEHDRDRRDRH